MNVLDFGKMKKEKRKISQVTCYDYWSARLIADSEIDCVLVGDSVSMVMHGYSSTVHATTEMMAFHAQAVARGLQATPPKAGGEKFLVVDMPFLTFRKGPEAALECVGELMRAGAHAVKLEGVWGHEQSVQAVVESGVPVMGHIGLTPQSIHSLGGFRVQGREQDAARDLVAQALELQKLGCFSIVLECVPSAVAKEISEKLAIPTIGIGAGAEVDGQVLVLQDLLGMNGEFKPKFLRKFMNGSEEIGQALNRYHREVQAGTYPAAKESY